MKEFFTKIKIAIKKQPPSRSIAIGFLMVIFLGSGLLMLPWSVNEGVTLDYIDALFTSTSAVCVTGLVVVETAETFSVFGKIVIALLIQIGGLGVITIGTGIMLAIGRRLDVKSRNVMKEAVNVYSTKGIVKFVKYIFLITLIVELVGACLNLIVFSKYFPIGKAIGVSVFHAISAFNNAGFDIFGNWQSMIGYQDNILLNLVTTGMIITGGIGFLVIHDVFHSKFRWKKFSMHTKVVLVMTVTLILGGMFLLKAVEDVSWLGAYFQSVSARTAGFATYDLSTWGGAGLAVLMLLMFIGASPGSTGGGIKTTTIFALLSGVKSEATNSSPKAFHYSLPKDVFKKAAIIFVLAIALIFVGTIMVCAFNPEMEFVKVLFEMTSAFGTVGLSTGITPSLAVGSKLVTMIIMFIGRLGPITIATLWFSAKGEEVRYPEGYLSIG